MPKRYSDLILSGVILFPGMLVILCVYCYLVSPEPLGSTKECLSWSLGKVCEAAARTSPLQGAAEGAGSVGGR